MLGTKILEERTSPFNGNLRVIKSFGLGTYIQADGLTQSGGIVETFWKQTLKRVKKDNPIINSCLILGLGGGTVAKLIQSYWPGIGITGVDIDREIVNLGLKYLELDKIQMDIQIRDASEIVPKKADLVIVDLYRGDVFPSKFESDRFLKSFAENKLVIFNRLYYKEKKALADEFGGKLRNFFRKVETFRPVTNIIYICSN